MEVKILGAHNLASSQTNPVSLLIDNVLALDAGSVASGLTFDEQNLVKTILLTHYHYDHIRDIPAIGLSTAYSPEPIEVCASQEVLDMVAEHLVNGKLYPDFRQWPAGCPAMRFRTLLPNKFYKIKNYEVLPLPVKHNVPTTGYYVKNQQGSSLFYTGDTGAGLSECWQAVSPQLLIIEVSGPNSIEQQMDESRHLTPNALKRELLEFRRIRGYLPQVLTIHFIPKLEEQTRAELEELARELKVDLRMANQGMKITL